MAADSWEMHPDYVTHYYRDLPFHSLTDVSPDERLQILEQMSQRHKLPRRLKSEFYFEQRQRYESLMYEQFQAKGGDPQRHCPHYGILGESEIWAAIYPRRLRIPLSVFPSRSVSFTYTDSFANYVDRDLDDNPIPRKPQYGTLYRREELAALFSRYGWPGDRWKTEVEWEHDLYVEAQIWDDGPLRPYFPAIHS